MFNWLFRKSTFHRFQDSYALREEAMFAGMVDALQARIAEGDCVFLMTHFPATFTRLEKKLAQLELNFSIVTGSIDSEMVAQLAARLPNQVHLTMAQMLQPDSALNVKVDHPDLAVVVCERHPMPKYDDAIAKWCHQLKYPVQLGYFLSLEDPIVSFVVPDQVKTLLEQFGLGENELITSSMVSKRLNSVLKRKAAKVVEEVAAESPEAWLAKNYR